MSSEKGGRYIAISKKQTGTAERVRYNAQSGIQLQSGRQVKMLGQDGGVQFGTYEEIAGGIVDVEWLNAPCNRQISRLSDGEKASIRAFTKNIKPGETVTLTVKETASDGSAKEHEFSGTVQQGGIAYLREVCGINCPEHGKNHTV